MTQPRTAQAADRPCIVHGYHAPGVSRTQAHHSKPQYLQLRLWGEIRYAADTDICGTGHDNVHAWADWLLGEAHKPNPEPGRLDKARAQAIVDWYVAEGGKI